MTLLEKVSLASGRLGHLPTGGERHVVGDDWCGGEPRGLGGEGVDGEGGGRGVGTDVMRGQGTAHSAIRTGLRGKKSMSSSSREAIKVLL